MHGFCAKPAPAPGQAPFCQSHATQCASDGDIVTLGGFWAVVSARGGCLIGGGRFGARGMFDCGGMRAGGGGKTLSY
ncbi:MAG: hypothetical protein RMM53_08595, partial [Bacteroidia bacterium]|nr:hypothetical protein [Bacteroidia bacterium]